MECLDLKYIKGLIQHFEIYPYSLCQVSDERIDTSLHLLILLLARKQN